jgi:hypothetical protein
MEGYYHTYVKPGTQIEAHAYAEGYDESPHQIVTIQETENRIDFTLNNAPPVIKGYVYDTDGNPVEGAGIYVKEDSQAFRESIGTQEAVSDEQGFFELPSHFFYKEAKVFSVTALKQKGIYTYKTTVNNIPLNGEPVYLIVSVSFNEEGSVYGRVMKDNQPLTEYQLLLVLDMHKNYVNSDSRWIPIASPDGTFYLDPVPANKNIRIAAYHDEYGVAYSQPFELKPLETKSGFVIEFPALVPLRGRVVNADTGKPLEGSMVWVTPSSDYRRERNMFVGRKRRPIGKGFTVLDQLEGKIPETTTGPAGGFTVLVPRQEVWVHAFEKNFHPFSRPIDASQSTPGEIVIPLEILHP